MFAAEGLPAWFVDSRPVGESPRGVTLENELKAGKYGVIRSLLRVLEGGAASKVPAPALLSSLLFPLLFPLCCFAYGIALPVM